jgi:hypothetical protein
MYIDNFSLNTHKCYTMISGKNQAFGLAKKLQAAASWKSPYPGGVSGGEISGRMKTGTQS